MRTEFSVSKFILSLLLVTAIATATSSFVINGKPESETRLSRHDYQTDSLFNPNSQAGWGTYPGSSYLKAMADSVLLEVILFRQVPTGSNWNLPSETGTIANSFRPLKGRNFSYKEPSRIWDITIQPDGKCFIRLLSGTIPSGNPVVLPVKIKYKK